MSIRHVLFVVITLSLYAHAEPGGRTSTFTISGMVVNAITNQPVPYARMTLLSTSSERVEQTIAGADGRFHFPSVPAAKYQLYGQRTGFPRQGLNQHEDFFTGVVTGPGQDTASIVFRLKPEATIAGRIIDDFGDPVEGASVMLFRRTSFGGRVTTVQYATDFTDDTGAYLIESLLPGTYLLAVNAQPWYAVPQPTLIKPADDLQLRAPDSLDLAFPVTFYPGTSDLAAASPIQLKAGTEFLADFQLKPVPAAHLVIHTDDLDNVEIATPLFDTGGLQHMGGQSFRSAEGDTELTGFAPGPVLVEMSRYGHEGSPEDNRQVNVDAGSVTSLSRAAMNFASNFTGNLEVDGEAAPLDNASLALRDQNSGRLYYIRVEGTRFSTVDVVPLGIYDVYLFAPGHYLRKLIGSGASPDSKSVEITAAADPDFKVEISRRTANIEGVATLNGKPFGGALILAISETDPQDQRWDRLDQSDSDGTFRLRDLAPGSYKVIALQNGWDIDHADRRLIQPFLSRAQHIDLGPGDTGTLQLGVQ